MNHPLESGQHPLTEEIMREIQGTRPGYNKLDDQADMRGAADWQLEQVIEWIEKKRGGSIKLHNSEINNLIIDLKKAMRPQEDN